MRRKTIHWTPNREASAFVVAAVLSQALQALLWVVGARLLGPSNLGVAAASIALSSWLVTLVDFGNSNYCAREIAATRMSGPEIYGRLLGRATIAAPAALAFSSYSAMSGSYMAVALASLTLIRVVQTSLAAALRGAGAVGSLALAAVLEPSVSLLMAVALPLQSPSSTTAFVISLLTGACAGTLTLVAAAARAFGPQLAPPIFRWRDCRNMGIFSTAVAAADLDVTIAACTTTTGVAGAYAAVSKWSRPMTTITQSFVTMALPRVAGARTDREAWSRVRSASWILAANMLLGAMLALAAPALVGVLLGGSFAHAVLALQVVAVAAVVGVPTQFLASFLIYRGRDSIVARIQVAATLLQLALVPILTPLQGSVGIGLAVLTGRLCALVAFTSALRRSQRMTIEARITDGDLDHAQLG